MRVFVENLIPCARTQYWPYTASARLFSDSLSILREAAASLRLSASRLEWSARGMPYFLLSPHERTRAYVGGAQPISSLEVADLEHMWAIRNERVLARLLDPVPQLACRLRRRPRQHP